MGFLNPKYPNLELLEYKVRTYFNNSPELQDRLKKRQSEKPYAKMDFDAMVFSQIWGSTNTGFDKTEDGFPAIGGCAMTKEYTTVIHEVLTHTWFVFFGDKLCYMVYNASDKFFEDLSKHQMASLSEAEELY